MVKRVRFAGDKPVEHVFCQNFTASQQGIGEVLSVSLCPDGEDRMVTEESRREYVELYINYVLNSSVHRQVLQSADWRKSWLSVYVHISDTSVNQTACIV